MKSKHIPYFTFYPSDFMNGVRGMTPQEVGVYTMLLCRIYEENGPVEVNMLRLSTYCGMREKTFQAVFNKLLDLGKFHLVDGAMMNARAEHEIQKRSNDLKIASAAGKASAQKRQQNQSSAATTVERPLNHTDTDTDTDTDNTSSFQSDVCLEAANAAPASPTVAELPALQGKLVKITEADVAIWSEAYPAIDVRQQLSAIRAWLINNPKNAKTANGMRRFVNSWLGREQDRRGRAPSGAGPPARPKSAFQQRHEDARDRLNKALGINDDDELNYDDGKVIDLGRANYRG